MFAHRFSTVVTNAFGLALVLGAFLLPAAHAQAEEEPLFAVLNGANECNSAAPPAGPVCRLGDPDGFGSATILFSEAPGGLLLCFGITVDNLNGAATAAHIHRGRATVNGPIVVNLAPPAAPAGSNPGASSGCVGIAAATAAAIIADPTEFYVNVHNGQFPNGALRGNLL